MDKQVKKMNPIYWYASEPSKHKEVQVGLYDSLTGNEWLDLLIVAALLLLPIMLLVWNIEREYK